MWRTLQYLKHHFYLRHRKGHGVHSPYLFEVIHRILFNAAGWIPPDGIRELHLELRRDRNVLSADGPGAPSRIRTAPERSVRSFARRSSVSLKYGALLYRFSRWFDPEVILELGTGIGISTMYLSSGSPDTPVHTIEGNRDRAVFSNRLFKRSGLPAVQLHVGEIGETLERMTGEVGGRILAFVDGNHRYEPTIGYLRWIVRQAGEEAVIIMDDLYWSREMQRAWQEAVKWPEVRISIDLFHMGVLLLRRDLNKVDVKVKF